jgi:hypothetical protein
MRTIEKGSPEIELLKQVWNDCFYPNGSLNIFLNVCEHIQKDKEKSVAWIESDCYRKFNSRFSIDDLSRIVDLVVSSDDIFEEYDDALLVYTKTPKVIDFYKDCKSAHAWGQGEIQGTPFTQLTYGSPMHKGDKRLLIFCHTKDLKQ